MIEKLFHAGIGFIAAAGLALLGALVSPAPAAEMPKFSTLDASLLGKVIVPPADCTTESCKLQRALIEHPVQSAKPVWQIGW
jgi:hypothetical protein